jgi:hypothetical protein
MRNFETRIVEKIRTYFPFENAFPKIVVLQENVEKYGSARRSKIKIKYGAFDLLAGKLMLQKHTHTEI